MNPGVTWGLGIAMTVWILYQGIPLGLKPDPTHAFGIYLSAVFVVVLISGMARVLTALYLLGLIDFPINGCCNRSATGWDNKF